MTDLHSTDRAHTPLGKRGAFEGVARRHGRRRNPARMTPRSSLRPPTNHALHSPQRVVRKVACSIKGSETPQSRSPAPATTRPPARTSHANKPKAKPRKARCGPSNGTLPDSSTISSPTRGAPLRRRRHRRATDRPNHSTLPEIPVHPQRPGNSDIARRRRSRTDALPTVDPTKPATSEPHLT